MELSLEGKQSWGAWIKTRFTLSRSALQGHDDKGKQDALYAVDILIKYKKDVQNFTDEIVEAWALPRKVMDRYSFDDVEQLNEWLDSLS